MRGGWRQEAKAVRDGAGVIKACLINHWSLHMTGGIIQYFLTLSDSKTVWYCLCLGVRIDFVRFRRKHLSQ